MPEVIIPIIIVPCMPTMDRYWLGPTTVGVVCSNSVRISIAFSPPTKKKSPIPTRYCIPTTLWSVQRPKYRPIPSLSFSRSDAGRPSRRETG